MARVGDNALRVRVDLSIASLLEVGEGRERRDGRERGDLGDGRAAGHASANLEGVGRHEEGGEGSDAVQHVESVHVRGLRIEVGSIEVPSHCSPVAAY